MGFARRAAFDFVETESRSLKEADHRSGSTSSASRSCAPPLSFAVLKEEAGAPLAHSALAWAIKEPAADLWDSRGRDSARKAWHRLLGWMARSRLQPMVKLGQTVRNQLSGILNVGMAGASNSLAENLNSRIQTIKARGNGFRNHDRMINAVYFHLSGLDLYPEKGTLRS